MFFLEKKCFETKKNFFKFFEVVVNVLVIEYFLPSDECVAEIELETSRERDRERGGNT